MYMSIYIDKKVMEVLPRFTDYCIFLEFVYSLPMYAGFHQASLPGGFTGSLVSFFKRFQHCPRNGDQPWSRMLTTVHGTGRYPGR